MRGTIEVHAENGTPLALWILSLCSSNWASISTRPSPQKSSHLKPASPERGAQFSRDCSLPYAIDRDTYLTTSPAKLWLRLRAEPTLSNLSDDDLWDAVAWIWQQQTTPEAMATGQKLYAANCAACHGETGKGDGVMVRGLPVWRPGSHPSGDMTNSTNRRGIIQPARFQRSQESAGGKPSPARREDHPRWNGNRHALLGTDFHPQQIDALVGYLYNFAWNSAQGKSPEMP